MAQLLSDADVGIAGGAPALLSDDDVGLSAPKSTAGGGPLGNLGTSGQILSGMPIIGPLAERGIAAANAGLAPAVDYARGLLGKPPLSPDTTFEQRYGQELAGQKAESEKYQQEHPAASVAANLAGGVAALGPATEYAPALFGLGEAGVIPSALYAGGTNALISAGDAALRGEDAARGAAIGGLAGSAGILGGRALGAVGSAIARPFRGTSGKAAEIVAQPLVDQGLTTPEAVTAKLNSIGPEATLVDVNPVTQQLGAGIAATPGEGQQILRQAIENRAAQSGQRIMSQIDASLGQPVDLDQMSKDIYSQAKAQAGPLYSSAYDAQITSNPALNSVLSSPLGQRAMNSAKRLSLSDPTAPPSIMFAKQSPTVTVPEGSARLVGQLRNQGVNEADIAKFTGLPTAEAQGVDVRGLHLVRQAYDDMIANAQRQGSNNLSRILNSQRSVIDQTLKDIPQFAQADRIYSDMSGIRQAMEDGQNVFKNSQTPEDVASAFRSMPQAQQQAYMQGARVAIRNVMGGARNDAAAARGMFAKGFNQDKLKLLLGEEGGNAVLNRIGAEQAYNTAAGRITGNSETAARLAAQAELAGAHGLPDYEQVAVFSGASGVARRVVAGMLKSTLNAIASGKQQAIQTKVAKLLTAKPGPERDAAINTVMDAASEKSGRVGKLVAHLVARYPSTQHNSSSK